MRLPRVQSLVEDLGDGLHFGVTHQRVLWRDLGGIRNHLKERAVWRTFVNRCIQTQGFFCRLEDLHHFLFGESHFFRYLLGSRFAAEFPCEGGLREFNGPVCLADVARHPNQLSLLVQRTLDCLHNPPSCVGAEAVAERVVELVDGFHQPEAPFLHQIQESERGFAEVVLLGDAGDESEVRFHNILLRGVRYLVDSFQFIPEPFDVGKFVANLFEDKPERARLPRCRLFRQNAGGQLLQQPRRLILQEFKLLKSEFFFHRAERRCAEKFLHAACDIGMPLGPFFQARLPFRHGVDATADGAARVGAEFLTASRRALFDGSPQAEARGTPQFGRRELRARCRR